MKVASEKSAFNIVGSPRKIEGFIHGMRNPCLIVLLQPTISNADTWLKSVNQAFAESFQGKVFSGLLPDIGSDQTLPEYAAMSVLFWIRCIYESARVPVFENGKIIGVDPDDQLVMITLPVLSSRHSQAISLLLWILSIYNAAAAGHDFHQLLERLPSMEKQIASPPFFYSNTFDFLGAAFQQNIPFMALSGEVYLMGYGSRSRLLESSFTDETSAIGTHLARIKTSTSEILSKAGIPVPEQRKVEDAISAEKAADELGFPVVVKPADLDGGVGVAAGLTTMDEVRKAFAIARQKSPKIILEKHIEGRDYRLRVFKNEILAALERIPGGVTGDGCSTIRQLVAKV
ncbi:MAG: hypothetical protein HGA87_07525, partial [Desulfobulbaceae bacterium]|nr:hypothetical protein [Desulfobulbaceae bacterium]